MRIHEALGTVPGTWWALSKCEPLLLLTMSPFIWGFCLVSYKVIDEREFWCFSFFPERKKETVDFRLMN